MTDTVLGLSGTPWAAIGALLAAIVPLTTWLVPLWLRKRRARLFAREPFAKKRNRRTVVGRDDAVEDLNDLLSGTNRAALLPMAAVTGGGGIGKTTLALFYRDKYRKSFDRYFDVDADTEVNLHRGLAKIADSLEGEEKHEPDKKRAETALRLLSDHAVNERILLIYDNANSPDLVEHWLPDGTNLTVLVTSRHPDWESSDFTVYRAGVLSQDKAVALLEQESKRSDPGFADLAEALGYLPLALVLAGEALRARPGRKTVAVKDYAARLAKHQANIPATRKQDDYALSTAGVVLGAMETLSKDARAVLQIIAWWAPEGLSASLFDGLRGKPWIARYLGWYSVVPRRIWRLAKDEARLDLAIQELRLNALLEDHGEQVAEQQLSLHRAYAAIVRDLNPKASKAAAAVLAAGYPSGVAPSISANWTDCARLTPHVLALERAGAPGIAASDYLFNQASLYLREMAFYDDAVRLAERALALTRARLPDSDRDVAIGWSMLGEAYREAGRLEEAVKAQEENVRLSEAHDHGAVGLATAYNNHALALGTLGKKTGDRDLLEQALAQSEKALGLFRETFGEESEEVGKSLANLAALQADLGQMEAALEHSGQALAIRSKLLPKGDARLGTSISNHGGNLLRAGKATEAEGVLREALALDRVAYGRDNHPYVTIDASWLVSCLLVLARGGDAEKRAEAEALCTEFGLDWEDLRRRSEQYPDPS